MARFSPTRRSQRQLSRITLHQAPTGGGCARRTETNSPSITETPTAKMSDSGRRLRQGKPKTDGTMIGSVTRYPGRRPTHLRQTDGTMIGSVTRYPGRRPTHPRLSPRLTPHPHPRLSPRLSPRLTPHPHPRLSPRLSPRLTPHPHLRPHLRLRLHRRLRRRLSPRQTTWTRTSSPPTRRRTLAGRNRLAGQTTR